MGYLLQPVHYDLVGVVPWLTNSISIQIIKLHVKVQLQSCSMQAIKDEVFTKELRNYHRWVQQHVFDQSAKQVSHATGLIRTKSPAE